jgi:hypothetical protein
LEDFQNLRDLDILGATGPESFDYGFSDILAPEFASLDVFTSSRLEPGV